MKTHILTLAAIILLSLSLSAKETTSINPDEVTVSEMSHSTYDASESLSIESWMTNDYIWNLTSTNSKEEKADNDELQISNWMTNSELWTPGVSKHATHIGFDNKNEEALSIEGWMTNGDCWSL